MGVLLAGPNKRAASAFLCLTKATKNAYRNKWEEILLSQINILLKHQ